MFSFVYHSTIFVLDDNNNEIFSNFSSLIMIANDVLAYHFIYMHALLSINATNANLTQN
jgi:hypothetical protein